MAKGEFAGDVEAAGRVGENGLADGVAFDVGGEIEGGGVALAGVGGGGHGDDGA